MQNSKKRKRSVNSDTEECKEKRYKEGNKEGGDGKEAKTDAKEEKKKEEIQLLISDIEKHPYFLPICSFMQNLAKEHRLQSIAEILSCAALAWQFVEYAGCLYHQVVPWNMLPPHLKEEYNLPLHDMGIDGIALEIRKKSLQVKFRPQSKYIGWNECCNFFGLSAVAQCQESIVMKQEDTKVDKTAQRLPGITFTNSPSISALETLLQHCLSFPLLSSLSSFSFSAQHELRPYQMEALSVLTQRRHEFSTRIQMACGTGKSLVMQRYIQNFPNEIHVICVPTCDLLVQMSRYFPGAHRVGAGFSVSATSVSQPSTNVYLTTYQSAYLLRTLLGNKIDNVFFDEGHRVEQLCVNRTAFENGTFYDDYSDFPPHDDNEEEDHKEEMEAGEHCFVQAVSLSCKRQLQFSATLSESRGGPIHFRYSLEQAIEQKFLTDYDIITIVTETSKSNYQDVLVEFLQKRTDLQHILAYANSIEEAKRFKNKLRQAGISAAHFSGQSSLSERKNYLQHFQQGTYRVLCTVYVLQEGIDLPCADTCLFVDQRYSKKIFTNAH
jgi:predicted helicase